MKKISKFLSENLPFYGGKIFSIMNRRVFVMINMFPEMVKGLFICL